MTSVWYPATGEGGDPARYMSSEVAKATTEPIPVDMPPEGLAGVATHASVDAEPKHGNWPVVVLSPGFSNARGTMTGLAEDLASKGYVVVTVDHTYEAPITFQDGRFTGCARPVPCGKSGDQKFLQRIVENRSQDLSFVLDELTGPNSPWSGSQYIDASRIGSAGHSIGGAAAAATAKNDPRVKAGANMDGTIYAPESLNGLDKPFLFLGSGPRVENPGMGPSWEHAWSRLAEWKRGLLVKDTGHSSFVDTPLFIDQLDLREQYPPDQLPAILGTLPAQRSADITRTYVSSMFD